MADVVSSPARRTSALTPHDTNQLPFTPKAVYVGTAGDVTLRAVDDTTDTVFKNVPAGSLLPVRAMFIRMTGTTAGSMIALG